MDLAEIERRELALCRRQAILRLEQQILGTPGAALAPECAPVQHHVAPGLYGREMFLPAGTVIVGKIHKHAHVNVISQGRVRVFTEGEGALELVAPYTFVSTPGTKRAVLPLEDTVWTTVHSTDKTDPAEIERDVITDDFQEVYL